MEMIGTNLEIKYRCPKCQLKFTRYSSFHSNIDIFDQISYKVKNRSCVSCEKEMFDVTFIKCKTIDVNRDYYYFKWKCKECSASWHSIKDDINTMIGINNYIREAHLEMHCVNDTCRSHNFHLVAFRLFTKGCSSEE